MNMDLELGKRVDGVLRDAEERRQTAEEILQLLSEISTHESFYYQGLSHLSFPTAASASVESFIGFFRLLCTLKAESAQRFSSYLQSDLIHPLRSLLLNQRSAYTIASQDISKAVKHMETLREQLETTETWYTVQLQRSEEFILRMEQTEGGEDRKKVMQDWPEDVNWSMERATMVYRDAVDGYNQTADTLRNQLLSFTSSLSSHEESRLSLFRHGLSQVSSLALQLSDDLHTSLTRDKEVVSI